MILVASLAAGIVVGVAPWTPARWLAALAIAGLAFLRLRSWREAVAVSSGTAVATLLWLDPATGTLAGVAAAVVAAGIVAAAAGVARRLRPLLLVVVAAGMLVPPTVVDRPDLRVSGSIDDRAALPLGEIDRWLRDEVREARIPALSIAVAHRGRVVMRRGYGPVAADTPFLIGSTSKSFTALAVAKLAADGRLDLDDPVVEHLPGFAGGDGRVTIRHLLSHTSGLDTWEGWQLLAGSGRADATAVRESLAGAELGHAPGTEAQYSNANFVTAGQVVEEVTGTSFAEHLTAEVLDPLGLDHTFATEDEARADGLVTGYRHWFGVPRPFDGAYLPVGLPAGFVASTADDMLRYLLVMADDGDTRVVPAGVRDELFAPHAPAPTSGPEGLPFDDQSFGLGWFTGPIHDVPVRWHTGGIANYGSVMAFAPGEDWAFVVLADTVSNTTRLPSALGEGVIALLAGDHPPSPGRAHRTGYLVFDLVVLSVVAGLVALARRSGRLRRRRASVVAAGALVLTVAGLLGVPRLMGIAVDPASPSQIVDWWKVLARFAPDAAVALAAILTGLAAVTVGAGRRALTRSPAPPAAEPEAVLPAEVVA